jgi:hypothetical protein
MAFSDNLRLTLITTGAEAGTWGTTTNTNLGTILEDAIVGYATVSVTSAAQAFTIVDGGYDQARLAMIRLTTTTAANFAVYAPPVSKPYILFNDSAYTATIYNSTVSGNTTAAGTGVTLPVGAIMAVWSNATNFYVQNSHIIGSFTGSLASATTATTQAEKTSDTTVATTAFVDRLRSLVTPTTTSSGGTLVVGDRGSLVSVTAGVTVPASVFAAQDVVTIYNNSASSITITQGASLTLRLVGTSSTGNRTLLQRGLATVVFISATEAVISGGGLS